MTNHVVRLYALAAALLVFFVAWAAIAANPWKASAAAGSQDPRFAAVRARELRLQREAVLVKQIVDGRWAVYRTKLARRHKLLAASKRAAVAAQAPSVKIVTLPPVTTTRTS
jgi:hypothetical protein